MGLQGSVMLEWWRRKRRLVRITTKSGNEIKFRRPKNTSAVEYRKMARSWMMTRDQFITQGPDMSATAISHHVTVRSDQIDTVEVW